jgi:hypothetical protein
MDLHAEHEIWSILSESLTVDLLQDISSLGQNMTPAFKLLRDILQQHPQLPPPESTANISTASSAEPATNTNSAGGCCRNGIKVGLKAVSTREKRGGKGIINSDEGAEANEVGEANEGGNYEDRYSKGRKRKTPEEQESDDGEENEREDEMAEGTNSTGKSTSQVTKSTKKPAKKPRKKPQKDAGQTEVYWLTNGTPPNMPEDTGILFHRLSTLSTTAGSTQLALLVNAIISDDFMEVNTSSSYDLTFKSIVLQCDKINGSKAVKNFHNAMLYIRLAFHIDQ